MEIKIYRQRLDTNSLVTYRWCWTAEQGGPMRRFTALIALGVTMTLVGTIGMAIENTRSERVHPHSELRGATLQALD
jgi:hypothetical protein